VIAAVFGMAAMFITAMLYATIPAMRSWHSPITVLAFISAGLVSGAASAYAISMGWASANYAGLHDALMIVIVIFAGFKFLQIRHFREAAGNVLSATGTGMAGRPYRLQDSGSTRRPYKTQTQIWPELPPRLRRALYSMVVALSVVIPLLLLSMTYDFTAAILMLVSVLLGVGGERWMFFADATHSSRVWFADQPKLPSPVRRDPKQAYSKSPV
jgi:DMSO reductase anchor subunit